MKDFTEIAVILDKSSSMQSLITATISGFNEFLHDQQAAPGGANLTLVQFSTDVDSPTYDAVPIASVANLSIHTYRPRGMTALLDAIGSTIDSLGDRLSNMKETDRPDKVIIVIITDGEENYSREYSKQRIFDMITTQRNEFNWQFVFLAANQDAIATAVTYGMNANAALNYAPQADSIGSSYKIMSRKLVGTRCAKTGTAAAEVSFDTSERAEVMKNDDNE